MLLPCSFAFADKPAPPFSYKQESPGGKYVFVMIAPGSIEKDVAHWNEGKVAEIREIRRTYLKSGLYRNDVSDEPLWTVDWYAYGVEVASDGVHLIRHGPWASSTDDEAISFFANGKKLRTYEVRELVDKPRLMEYSVSHFRWQKDRWFDDDRLEYGLATLDGNQFVFDVRTGEIITKWPPKTRIVVALFLVVALSGLVILGCVIVRRWQRARSPITNPKSNLTA
jgi:hypothetical protein